MTRLLRLALALAFAVASLVVLGPPAHACSCAPMTTAERVEAFDQVFTGTVSDQDHGEQPRGTSTYNIAVEDVYKGEVELQQPVASAFSSCGLGTLPEDQPIVFFTSSRAPTGASTNGRALFTSICSGTQPSGAALVGEVRAELGEPHDPTPPPTGAEPGDPTGDGSTATASGTDDAAGGSGDGDGIGADDGSVLWPVLGALVVLGVAVAGPLSRRQARPGLKP